MAFSTIPGSSATDVTSYVGTSGADVILTVNETNAEITGLAAADTVTLSHYTLNNSNFTVKGGQGIDTITTGTGGTETLSESLINGNADADNIDLASLANTTVYGGQGADAIDVDAGSVITGSLINGNKNQDRIDLDTAAVEASSVFGGQGRDTIIIDGTVSNSTIRGDLDIDTIELDAADTVVNSVLVNGNGGDDNIDVDFSTASADHTVRGGGGNDNIAAEGASNEAYNFMGDAGNDTLVDDGTGESTLDGGTGNDTLDGSGGADYFITGTGIDVVTVAAGDGVAATAVALSTGAAVANGDTVTFGNGVDIVSDFDYTVDTVNMAAAGAVTAIGVTKDGSFTDNANYFAYGTWVESTGKFEIDAGGADTMLFTANGTDFLATDDFDDVTVLLGTGGNFVTGDVV